MSEETLLSAARRVVRFFNIDMNKGGLITVETQQAVETLDGEVRKEAARKPGGYGSDAVEVVMQSISRPLWPNTSQSDWCGEHQPKDPADGK